MSKDKRQDRFIRLNLEPQKLRHFLAVYDCGNFGQAANANNVTQQAVSKAIASLEDQLSLQLFERNAYGAEPTSYAHALAKRAKIIISESRLAMAELSAMRGSTAGYVQLGLGWSFFTRIGPAAIERFRENRPGIGLRVAGGASSTLYPSLIKGELDFVVSAPPMEQEIDPSIETSVLFYEHDAVVVRKQHPLADKKSLTLNDLSSCSWLISLSLPDRWDAICAAFAARGIDPPNDVIDLNSLSLSKSMLLRGDYVSLFSEEMVATEVETDLFRTFRIDDLPLNRPALLATRKGTELQPAASVLLKYILEFRDEFYPSYSSNRGDY